MATSLGIKLRGGHRAEVDLDFRGTLGVAKEAPVSFREIRLFARSRAPSAGPEVAPTVPT